MFSYYGSKSKIVKKYPKPLHNLIIEPFAGSARYSLLYWNKRILLNDLHEPIYTIWKYLIKATKKQIKNLPDIKKRGISVKDFDITYAEKILMGFMMNCGVSSPRFTYNERALNMDLIQTTKKTILHCINNIKHWEITNKDYKELENIKATWFIDPPYQYGGEHYPKSKINYPELAEWCKSRKGQIIVCENSKANWMDFRPLSILSGNRKMSMEMIWTNTKPPGLLAPKEYLKYN